MTQNMTQLTRHSRCRPSRRERHVADTRAQFASIAAHALGAMMLFLASPSAACAANADNVDISAAALEEHWRFLADDGLQGRDDGSTGFEIAARHVKAAMASAGLIAAGSDGWLQPVPLWVRQGTASRFPFITVNGRRYDHGVSTHMRLENERSIQGSAVFAGYGLVDRKSGIDDYAGLDVKGKFVVAFSGTPRGLAPELAYEKEFAARHRGAIGLLIIREKENRQKSFEPVSAPVGTRLKKMAPDSKLSSATIPLDTARDLFAGSRRNFDTLLTAADEGRRLPSFNLKAQVRLDANVEDVPSISSNVLGAIPGTDLSHEVVLVTAHLDHLGVHQNPRELDAIHNGAMDNAIGVSIMLEIARALSLGPRPRRTILFAATTAEEDGLLGARHLSDNPLPAGGKPVAVVNLDMPILTYNFTDVRFVGGQESQLGDVAQVVAGRFGIASAPLGSLHDWFERSDQWPFVQKGVPALFSALGPANGGDLAAKEFLDKHYHQPSDDLNITVSWDAARKFALVHRDIVAAVANADNAPLWYADSVIGKTYAPEAPKARR